MPSRIFLATLFLGAALAASGQSVIPPTSAIGAADATLQRVPVNGMESGENIHRGAWKMSELYVAPAGRIEPKIGRTALALGAGKVDPQYLSDLSAYSPGQEEER